MIPAPTRKVMNLLSTDLQDAMIHWLKCLIIITHIGTWLPKSRMQKPILLIT